MKKLLLSLFTLIVIASSAVAAPISEVVAREKAAQFLLSKDGSAMAARGAKRFGGSGSLLTVAERHEAFYVFNNGTDGGYVIVSGDDRMPDVLGYSYCGTYNAEEIPDNMRSWLEGYAEQYEYLQSHSEGRGVTLTTVEGDAIAPMIETHWTQKAPYNDKCPLVGEDTTLTGCVATALAQIMYYYKSPARTLQTIPAYRTMSNRISMPAIDITDIDWDNMLTEYTAEASEAQKDAISTLMLLCGCGVRMDYGVKSSGAYDYNVKNALLKYFGYSRLNLSLVYRALYEDDALWNQMIYDELKDGRPVYYSGRVGNSGHTFVIDGYDKDDYFHVNWGWGGKDDGYFLLSALLYYNENQTAIIGIDDGRSGSRLPYAELKDGVLTYYYDTNYNSREGTILSWDNYNWDSADDKNLVTEAVFDPSCAEYKYPDLSDFFEGFTNLTSIQGLEYLVSDNVTTTSGMFHSCSSLRSVDLSSLNTEKVNNMALMFYKCSSLTTLDISNFDTRKVTNMNSTFEDCTSLQKIYAGDNWSVENVKDSKEMFLNCTSLVGQAGTQYDPEHIDQTYARIDGGIEAPGYLSKSYVPGIRGDVNEDGVVNGTDIQEVINIIVNK